MVVDDMRLVLQTVNNTTTEPAFLAGVRLRAQRKVAWMRSLWSQDANAMQGLAISDTEVDRVLGDPAGLAAAETEFYRSNPAARSLSLAIEQVEGQGATEPRWSRLNAEFGLNPAETALLAVALVVESDHWWRRVFGYLHDDATIGYATLWLARGLYGWDSEVRLGPSSALVRWQLARPIDGYPNPWAAATPWQADPHLLPWLFAGDAVDPSLGSAARLVSAPVSTGCLYPESMAAMHRFAVVLGHDAGTAVEMEIVAPEGAGRATLASQLCARLGRDMLWMDAESPGGGQEHFRRAVRLARLCGAALYWHNADYVDVNLLRDIRGETELTLYGTATQLQWPPDARVARLSVKLPRLNQRERLRLWNEMGGGAAPQCVADSQLLPGEMAAAITASPAGEEALEQTCRSLLRQAPGELLTVLPLPYEWNDIVLAPPLQEHLEELESQVRLRIAVLEDWGFERLTPMGRGISALFAGPSGTGKTMAAQVMGRSLGLEVRRVDLSSVVNKYIGETEKRLKQVFDICERDNVILFFDEADALFGQRTQVKDAHDRFANIEINYLLQRMEQFDGLAILATNRKEDLDRAFLRRLRFIIDFLPPAPAERLRLWHKALPAKTAEVLELLEPGIPFQKLATELDLTGAAIKASALRAAFLARAERSRIGLRHIVASVRREMQKQGQVLRAGDLEEFKWPVSSA
jgi:hypothetical protein